MSRVTRNQVTRYRLDDLTSDLSRAVGADPALLDKVVKVISKAGTGAALFDADASKTLAQLPKAFQAQAIGTALVTAHGAKMQSALDGKTKMKDVLEAVKKLPNDAMRPVVVFFENQTRDRPVRLDDGADVLDYLWTDLSLKTSVGEADGTPQKIAFGEGWSGGGARGEAFQLRKGDDGWEMAAKPTLDNRQASAAFRQHGAKETDVDGSKDLSFSLSSLSSATLSELLAELVEMNANPDPSLMTAREGAGLDKLDPNVAFVEDAKAALRSVLNDKLDSSETLAKGLQQDIAAAVDPSADTGKQTPRIGRIKSNVMFSILKRLGIVEEA